MKYTEIKVLNKCWMCKIISPLIWYNCPHGLEPVEGDSINEPLPRYDENPEGPYQAFRERDWPTDGIVTVELGTDRVCGSFTYCNGPLKPDTTYLWVCVFMNGVREHITTKLCCTNPTKSLFFIPYQINWFLNGRLCSRSHLSEVTLRPLF